MRNVSRPSDDTLEQVYWFLFLLAWIPIICAYSWFPDFFGYIKDGVDKTSIVLPEQKFFFRNILGIYALNVVLMFLISIYLKKIDYIIPIIFSAFSIFIYTFNNSIIFSGVQAITYTIYILLFLHSVYFFLKNGHLLSPSFITFASFLIFDCILLIVFEKLFGYSDSPSIFGAVMHLYDATLMNVMFFILISILIRMGYLIWRDNQDFVKQLAKSNKEAFSECRNTALKLWYPMLVIFTVFSVGYYLLFSLVLEPKVVNHLNTQNPALAKVSEEQRPASLEKSMQSFNAGFVADADAKSKAAIASSTAKIQADTKGAPDVVMAEINQHMPHRLPGTETRGCGFLDILCYVENGIKSATNSVYQKVKRRQMAVLRQKLVDIEADVDASAADKSQRMAQAISSELGKVQSMNSTGIAAFFQSYRNLSVLIAIYGLIVLLKTYIIVFSRVLFSPKVPSGSYAGGGLTANFTQGNAPPDGGNIKLHGQEYTINKSDRRDFYLSRNSVFVSGPAPARRNPLGFFAPFSRLWHGKWSMNLVQGCRIGADQQSAKVSVNAPAEIIEWNLVEGERIAFSFADFIGMSSTITLSRFVSMSISTMIFGRTIYYSAEGPGVLLVKSRASAAASPSRNASQSASASKLVNWELRTNFSVAASLTIMDTFLSDYNIKKGTKDFVVWDTDVNRGAGRGAGILRFVKSFLLPI